MLSSVNLATLVTSCLTKLDIQSESETFVNDSHLVEFSDIHAFSGNISFTNSYIKEVNALGNDKAGKEFKNKFDTVSNMVTYICNQNDFIKGAYLPLFLILLFSLSIYTPNNQILISQQISDLEDFCDMTPNVIKYFLQHGKIVRYDGSDHIIQGLLLVYLNFGAVH